MEKKALVLVSGGMDSAVTLALAVHEGRSCEAVSFYYGSRHQDAESQAARDICEFYGVHRHIIEIPRLRGSALTGDHPLPVGRTLEEMEAAGVAPSYVPARNTVLLALAASIADAEGIDEIWYGAHQEDHVGYPDCRPSYARAMGLAVELGTRGQVQLVAPWISQHKADIVRRGMELGVPFRLTHSCYQGHRPACGTCDTCTVRLDAFRQAGYEDPLEYYRPFVADNPLKWPETQALKAARDRLAERLNQVPPEERVAYRDALMKEINGE